MIISCHVCHKSIRVKIPDDFNIEKSNIAYGCPYCHTRNEVQFCDQTQQERKPHKISSTIDEKGRPYDA